MNQRDATAVPVLAVVGPTASGKTSLGIALARGLGAEIISADSVQVYQCLDIGSGKASAAEQAQVPHHCLDLVEPDQPFDAAAFRDAAEDALLQLSQRGRRGLVVGGTGLYLRALLHGLAPALAVPPALRAQLEAETAALPSEALHARLALVDPTLARRLAPRDRVRILRGLEVHAATGRPLSEHQAEHSFREQRHPALVIGLELEREELRRRIAARCHAMVEQGFLDEVARLREKGYGPELKPMQSLGYKHMNWVLDGRCPMAEALELQIRDTLRYARRQMTWFRALPEVHWLRPDEALERGLALAEEHLGWAAAARAQAPVAGATEEDP